jgi:hypothetical protein
MADSPCEKSRVLRTEYVLIGRGELNHNQNQIERERAKPMGSLLPGELLEQLNDRLISQLKRLVFLFKIERFASRTQTIPSC